MKFILIFSLFVSVVFADFYVQEGSKKVKMQVSKTSQINLANLRKIPQVIASMKNIKIFNDEDDFVLKDAHFRLLRLYPKKSFSIAVKKMQDKSFFIDLRRDDKSKVLQLFYHKKWYTILLEKPIKILHQSFVNLDIKQKDLDIKELQTLIKQARKAFPLDDKLKTKEMEINNRIANEFNEHSNHMEQGIIF